MSANYYEGLSPDEEEMARREAEGTEHFPSAESADWVKKARREDGMTGPASGQPAKRDESDPNQ